MIQVQGIAKAFGPQTLFESVHWQILPRRRYGLVGPNGAGKTTLLRILAGELQPDAGSLSRPKTLRVGYLPQDVEDVGQGGVLQAVLADMPGWLASRARLRAVQQRMADDHDYAASEAALEDLDKAQIGFEQAGGDELEVRAQQVLGGLGFGRDALQAPVASLSGGWRMRVALAKLLVQRPDVLLLDEPTNHLDFESLAWFEEFLEEYEGAIIAVSHDRYFLSRLPTHIVELTKKGVREYVGGYEDFLEGREARLQGQLAQKAKVDRQRAHLESFVRRFAAKASKAKQAQSRVKALARLEHVDVDHTSQQQLGLRFPEPARTGKEVLALEHVRKSWGDKPVYTDLSLTIWRGEKVALVGPNGAGKSTLLKILAGVTDTQGGEIRLGGGVVREWYAQHQLETLHVGSTIYEEARRAAGDQTVPLVRSILGSLGFSGQSVDKRVGVLSGGEKARVALARMVLRRPNLLLLDEPTNHLDLTTREVLEQALSDFPGTVVIVSHDRYFINAVATQILEVQPGGQVTRFAGDYDAYLYRRSGGDPEAIERLLRGEVQFSRDAASALPVAPKSDAAADRAKPDDKTRKRQEAEQRQEIHRRTKELRQRLVACEKQIELDEQRLQEIGLLQADPSLYEDSQRVRALLLEQAERKKQLDDQMAEWERLSLRIEAIEAEVMAG